jgi:hypothetical protein
MTTVTMKAMPAISKLVTPGKLRQYKLLDLVTDCCRYATMSRALNATGRPILYSLCNWGEDYPWNWGSTIANSWRISGDVYDSFDEYDARCPWYITLNSTKLC